MAYNIKPYIPLTLSGGSITQKVSGTALKLLGADADILSLGDATHEGGDLKVYRNATGDLALSFDADAASNAMALSVYGGVVAQNYLTVGTTAVSVYYSLYVAGNTGVNDWINVLASNRGIRTTVNFGILNLHIPVNSGSATHQIRTRINDENIIVAQATGDGAGGIVGKRSIQYGGQCHAKTDAGAADYNPSTITSDYIITTDTTAAARAVTISTEDRDSGTAANPRIFIIKDIAGNAAANNITVSLETAGTIDGAATFVVNGDYNSITLLIDGTNGYVI